MKKLMPINPVHITVYNIYKIAIFSCLYVFAAKTGKQLDIWHETCLIVSEISVCSVCFRCFLKVFSSERCMDLGIKCA